MFALAAQNPTVYLLMRVLKARTPPLYVPDAVLQQWFVMYDDSEPISSAGHLELRYGDYHQMQIQMCRMGAKGYLWLWQMVVGLVTDGDVLPKLACCARYFRYDIDFSPHTRATIEALQLVEFWYYREYWWMGPYYGLEGYGRCDCCFCICDFHPCGCGCDHCCLNSLCSIPYLDSDIEYWSD